jgi:hypothetical protein
LVPLMQEHKPSGMTEAVVQGSLAIDHHASLSGAPRIGWLIRGAPVENKGH